jgi:gluconokinase
MSDTFPRSSYEKVGGIVFFGRMLDKIRLHNQGTLPDDYNLGVGFDERCIKFLNIKYDELIERVLQGGSDEDILAWCFDKGRKPSDNDIEIWNGFMTKVGWRDDNSEKLVERKRLGGFTDRDDIQTNFDFHDADEGRI